MGQNHSHVRDFDLWPQRTRCHVLVGFLAGDRHGQSHRLLRGHPLGGGAERTLAHTHSDTLVRAPTYTLALAHSPTHTHTCTASSLTDLGTVIRRNPRQSSVKERPKISKIRNLPDLSAVTDPVPLRRSCP